MFIKNTYDKIFAIIQRVIRHTSSLFYLLLTLIVLILGIRNLRRYSDINVALTFISFFIMGSLILNDKEKNSIHEDNSLEIASNPISVLENITAYVAESSLVALVVMVILYFTLKDNAYIPVKTYAKVFVIMFLLFTSLAAIRTSYKAFRQSRNFAVKDEINIFSSVLILFLCSLGYFTLALIIVLIFLAFSIFIVYGGLSTDSMRRVNRHSIRRSKREHVSLEDEFNYASENHFKEDFSKDDEE